MSDKLPYINIHTHSPKEDELTITTIGVHPYDAEKYSTEVLEANITPQIDAIGEIGLDYSIDVDRATQETLFRDQLEIAQRAQLPVVIHAVRSFDMALKIIGDYRLKAVIFHGFIGSLQQAEAAQCKGYYLSFGHRCFTSPKTLDSLRNSLIDNMFLETDNEEISIEDIYKQALEYRSESEIEFKEKIYNNYKRVF